MSTSKFITKEAGRFSFICWSWETSQAWGHEVRLLKDGREVARERVRYYNRTWEVYQYQSAMAGAVYNYGREKLERLLEEKRETYGGRLPRGERQNCEAIIRDDQELQGLRDFVNLHAETSAYKKLTGRA